MALKFGTQTLNGHLIYYEEPYKHRWLDVVGPHAIKFVDDFTCTPADANGDPAYATVTAVSSGTGTSTITQRDAQNGWLYFDAAANENDGVQMQVLGESFSLTTNDPLYFGVRFQATEATQSDIIIGLAVTGTTLISSVVNGVYLSKADGGTTLNGVCDDNAAGNTALTTAFAKDTNYIVEFYWDGTDRIKWYLDGSYIGAYTTAANIPTDEELRVSLAYLNGDGTMEHDGMYVDWVRCIQILASR